MKTQRSYRLYFMKKNAIHIPDNLTQLDLCFIEYLGHLFIAYLF